MSKLAIKGSKTSGRFVIALLKMMGGKDNVIPCGGTDDDFYYFIDSDGIIKHQTKWNKDKAGFAQYTYGEFVENFPYKVGDKVRYFIFDVAADCPVEETAVVRTMTWQKDTVVYTLADNTKRLAKDMYSIEKEVSPDKVPVLEGQDYSRGRCGYRIPEGFEFDKVEEGEIILKPKKKELPKTYGECCEVLGMQSNLYLQLSSQAIGGEVEEHSYGYGISHKMNVLYELLVCRDAYWKLADGWKPAYGLHDKKECYYTLTAYGCGIASEFCDDPNKYSVLMFPTTEMRDTFYENFRDLIYECKELL